MTKHKLRNVTRVDDVHVNWDAGAIVPDGNKTAHTIDFDPQACHATSALHVVSSVDEDLVEYLEQCSRVQQRPTKHAMRGGIKNWHFALGGCDAAHIGVRAKEHMLYATF